MSFLTAEWRKLILANYSIDPDLLKDFIPKGTELDFWNGKCYVSLVGFMFKNTKVLGIKVPYLHTFEEVNLRFYVKRKEGSQWKRGVVFIKEIVPKRILSFVANTIYHEHYITLPMSHTWEVNASEMEISYQWELKKQLQSIKVITKKTPQKFAANSEIEFISEHYFGYTKYNTSKTYEYEVTHPSWSYYNVKDVSINVDFELNYGISFASLNHQEPESVFLMEGSEITVEPKKSIR